MKHVTSYIRQQHKHFFDMEQVSPCATDLQAASCEGLCPCRFTNWLSVQHSSSGHRIKLMHRFVQHQPETD